MSEDKIGSGHSVLRFSGHETFVFRYAWPAKGVVGCSRDSSIFSQELAMVELGVGRNMVNSIRYWCEVLRLVTPLHRSGVVPTPLGKLLIVGPDAPRPGDEPNGRDPYLEDLGTLWLLHYLLCSREEGASTWHLTFTQFSLDHFSRDALLGWLARKASVAGARVSRETLERDVQAFLRTYVPTRAKKGTLSEDSFDCPLVELGLLSEREDGSLDFTRSRRSSLPQRIFEFALLDYWSGWADLQQSLSFDRLLYGPGSPGAIFKLSENELAERLEQLPKALGIEYQETAGTRQLYGTPDYSEAARLNILETHYKRVYREAE